MPTETGTSEREKFLRHIAIKTNIKNLISGEYIQENEQSSNYLLTENNQKIFRLNTVAVIIKKEVRGSITNLLIEDGSGEIVLRLFEENKITEGLVIGDVVLIVGRVRMYNQEKYISSETIKKVNPLWLRVRSLELKKEIKNNEQEEVEIANKDGSQNKSENKINKIENNLKEDFEKENGIEEEKEDFLLPIQKLRKLILELDTGDGVLIEELIEKSPLEKTEELIEKMLENGDVFQNTPGRIRVL